MALSTLVHLRGLATHEIVTVCKHGTSLAVRWGSSVLWHPRWKGTHFSAHFFWLLSIVVFRRCMRRVVGHVTARCLLRRPLTSVLQHTYKFMGKMGFWTCDIWPTVRHELRMLRGLLSFSQSNLRLRTWPNILAYDACLAVCGVVSCVSSFTEARLCPWDERWRVRDEDFARRHPQGYALAEFVQFERVSSDICADVSTVLPHEVPRRNLESVPGAFLSKERWNDKYASRFHHDDPVHLLHFSFVWS